MKIVYSFIKTSYSPTAPELFAKISNKLIQKHGYETELYVDKHNYHIFKNISYNNIVILDDKEIQELPSNVWSAGKLLTFSKINEPFFHLDMDLFFIENYLSKFLNSELSFFHEEPWYNIAKIKKKLNVITNHFINTNSNNFSLNPDSLNSINCAIVGGTNFKIINQNSSLIIEYLKKHKDFIQLNSNKYKTLSAIFFEQVLFTNMCINNIINWSPFLIQECDETSSFYQNYLDIKVHNSKLKLVNCLYNQMIEKKVIHLWGSKTKFLPKIKKDFNL
jgi:hypothetical protein